MTDTETFDDPGNRKAFDRLVVSLQAEERLTGDHEAAIAQGRLLASQIDAEPFGTHAPKWHHEYRQIWTWLVGDQVDDTPEEPEALEVQKSPAELLIEKLSSL